MKKNRIFLFNFKNGGSPLNSFFSFYSIFLLPLVVAKKIGRRRRRILLLTLLYKGQRGHKFWPLNLGLPHEEKPNILITYWSSIAKYVWGGDDTYSIPVYELMVETLEINSQANFFIIGLRSEQTKKKKKGFWDPSMQQKIFLYSTYISNS